MLRRLVSTGRGHPVTRPCTGSIYRPGDIVEVQTYTLVLQ